jgi:uncharacterized membrane protein YphA (DoxX/SURF4 family)
MSEITTRVTAGHLSTPATRTSATVVTHRQLPTTRSRIARIAIFAARLVLAAVFVQAAFAKLTLNDQAVAGFSQLGGIPMLIFVGLLEVAGAIGLVVPVLSGFASIGTSALLLIITLVSASLLGAAATVLPAGCLVLSLAIVYLQRHQTVRLARWLRRAVTK